MSGNDPHLGSSDATVASSVGPNINDPYSLHESAIREPPTSLRESLKYLGPGFILSASIVGSGELIATTIVGAKAGFVLMWFIIFSCLVKVAVQLEFGKHAISSGESTMASLNSLPGPKLGRANWSIWTWLLLMIAKMMQVGGIVGGVVLAVEQFVPSPSVFDLAHIDASKAVTVSVNEVQDDPITLSANWTAGTLMDELTGLDSNETAWELENNSLVTSDVGVKRLVFDYGDSPIEVGPNLSLKRILLSFLVAASVSLLVYRGYYLLIEKTSLVMIGAFTLFTLASLFALQTTDLAITSGEFFTGCIPSIPNREFIFVAIGAFGITGVGGDEIMAYNYWLIEKGYASYTGVKNDSGEWSRRAKGWIRIMYWDAFLSMIAYTSMTVMFYLLGAAVLHRQGTVPAEGDLIATLGTMYTESLGPWARSIFVIGAIVVLYSTLFAALAAWTRMFTDAFGRVGLYQFENASSRRKAISFFAWVIPAIWATLFLFIGKPALMVILGGTSTVVILLIVVFATLWFRYRRLDQRLLPTKLYDLWLWLSSIAIVIVAVIGIVKLLGWM